MAITDIQIDEELRVGAPSITYENDDLTPANPQLIAGPDRYQRILEDLINELESELGRELTDEEYEKAGSDAYDIFSSDNYLAEGGPVDYSKDKNYQGWKKTYEINPDAAEMNEKHETYLKFYNREKKAYGGIMGMDGRKEYGIGSWFQENIMDPIKKNPLVAAGAAALAVDQFGIPGTGIGGNKKTQGFLSNILSKFRPSAPTKKAIGVDEKDGSIIYETIKGSDSDKKSFLKKLADSDAFKEGIAQSIIPIAGGLTAGLFADKIDKPEEIGLDRGTGVGLQNVRKVANLLDQKQGAAAGLNFLPDVEARKFSPAEMAVAYGSTDTTPIEKLAEGGTAGDRITAQQLIQRLQELNMEMLQAEGQEVVQLMRESLSIRDRLKKLKREGVDVESVEDEMKLSFRGSPAGESLVESSARAVQAPIRTSEGTFYPDRIMRPKGKPTPPDEVVDMMKGIRLSSRPDAMDLPSVFKPKMMRASMKKPETEQIVEKIRELVSPSEDIEEVYEGMSRRNRAEGGIMDLGGLEKDFRETGGFVAIGEKEKLDDVPARLSVNEFVFTADAVRGAGDGDVDEGARRLQGIMKQLEKRGQKGQDMIDVSERLSEVTA